MYDVAVLREWGLRQGFRLGTVASRFRVKVAGILAKVYDWVFGRITRGLKNYLHYFGGSLL